MAELRAQHMSSDKLYPAGSMIHMEQDPGGDMTGGVRDNSYFNEIIVSSTMFSSHMPNTYASACKELHHQVCGS